MYRDPEAARALGYDDVVAPPTFAIVLTREATNQAIHIAKLREDKEKAEIELRALEPGATDRMPPEDASVLLARLPDLSHALQRAPAELKRQVFDAFQLNIIYDKVERRIEISATITETVAQTLENAKDLPKEVSSVAHRDIAGAGFEPATFGL